MLWESLVTAGHVRAARFRFVAIPIVAIGAGLVILAQPPGGLAFSEAGFQRFGNIGYDYHSRAAQPVLAKMAPPRLQLPPDVMKQLAPAKELADVAKLIGDSLQTSNALPKDLPIKEISGTDFWSWKWSPTDINHFQKDGIHVFGAVVTPFTPDPRTPNNYYGIEPVRWLVIFRKEKDQWHSATLAYQNSFYVPTGATGVKPDDIPVTLRNLMDIEEFKP